MWNCSIICSCVTLYYRIVDTVTSVCKHPDTWRCRGGEMTTSGLSRRDPLTFRPGNNNYFSSFSYHPRWINYHGSRMAVGWLGLPEFVGVILVWRNQFINLSSPIVGARRRLHRRLTRDTSLLPQSTHIVNLSAIAGMYVSTGVQYIEEQVDTTDCRS